MDRKTIFWLAIGAIFLFSGEKKKASNLSGIRRKRKGLGDITQSTWRKDKEITPELLAKAKEQYKKIGWSFVHDIYAEANAPQEVKGINRWGDEIIGYEYSPEYFLKSNATNMPVRYYIELENGAIVHPDELYRIKIDKSGKVTLPQYEAISVKVEGGKPTTYRSFEKAYPLYKTDKNITMTNKESGISITLPSSDWWKLNSKLSMAFKGHDKTFSEALDIISSYYPEAIDKPQPESKPEIKTWEKAENKQKGQMNLFGLGWTKAIKTDLAPLAEEAKNYSNPDEFANAFYGRGGRMMSQSGEYHSERISRISQIDDESNPQLSQFVKQYPEQTRNIPGLNRIKGNEKTVTIYRSATGDIRPGDWVALSSTYAKGHSRSKEHKVYSMQVPISDIVWAGTSAEEWFYAPKSAIKEFKDFDPKKFYTDVIKGNLAGLGRLSKTERERIESFTTYQRNVEKDNPIFKYSAKSLRKTACEDVGYKQYPDKFNTVTEARKVANKIPDSTIEKDGFDYVVMYRQPFAKACIAEDIYPKKQKSDMEISNKKVVEAIKLKRAAKPSKAAENMPKGQMQLFDVPSLNLRGLTMAEIEKIIGGWQVSNLFKEGGIVYKPIVNRYGDKTFEPEAYKALVGAEGIAPARTVKRDGIEYIAYPIYPHIISEVDIPREQRRQVIPTIAKNIPRINRAIASVSNRGICYNDWLQFGLNNKHKMDLLDFSNSQTCRDPIGENYFQLSGFYKIFGLDKLSEIVDLSMIYKNLLDTYKPDEIRHNSEDTLLHPSETAVLKQILYSRDVKPNNVYYATNWRHINLPVGQTEPIDGTKYVYSDKKLSQRDIDSWEMTPVYEQPEPDEPKHKNPDWTWELKAETKPKKKTIPEQSSFTEPTQMTLFGNIKPFIYGGRQWHR
jgi:hypothetical protein